jgi:hypothetical protein
MARSINEDLKIGEPAIFAIMFVKRDGGLQLNPPGKYDIEDHTGNIFTIMFDPTHSLLIPSLRVGRLRFATVG